MNCKRLSTSHIAITVILVVCSWILDAESAEDLIVDGIEVVDGGDFGHIFVRNNGDLTINGSISADEVVLQWGKITINGNDNSVRQVTVTSDTKVFLIRQRGQWEDLCYWRLVWYI